MKMKFESLIAWLPDANERALIIAVLRAKKKTAYNVEKEVTEVLEVLHLTGYAVVPRGLLDAIYHEGQRYEK